MRIAATAALAFALLAIAPSEGHGAAPQSGTCQEFVYSYAGYAEIAPAYGVAATVTALREPQVADGHLAAWVGVGGEGFGAHGEDEWIQIGIASQSEASDGNGDGSPSTGSPAPTTTDALPATQPGISIGHWIYVEEVHGKTPAYLPIQRAATGVTYRIAVLEMAGSPGWWRAWLNGIPVSRPFYLGFSRHDVPRPQVLAESWNPSYQQQSCNHFRYRFAAVRVALAPGGSWSWASLGAGKMLDPHYRLLTLSHGFITSG